MAWYPDKSQWRIIWVVFVLAVLVSVDWSGEYPMKASTFIFYLVIAGGLLVWRNQARRDTTERKPD